MPRILDPAAPLTGDVLRALTKHDLKLARLEMRWDQRFWADVWVEKAWLVQRVWRGERARCVANARRKFRDRRDASLALTRRAREHVLAHRKCEDAAALEAAHWLLDEATGLDESCGEATMLRGELFAEQRHFAEALAAFQRALELLPDERGDARALLLRARVALQAGEWLLAEQDLSQLLEQEPPAPPTRAGHDLSLLSRQSVSTLSDDRSTRTATAPRKLVGLDDAFAHAHFLRGSARAQLGEWLGAEHDFARWLASIPEVPKVVPLKAGFDPVTAAPRERRKQAERDARDTIARHRAKALECLGMAHAANHRWSEAVLLLTDAVAIEPAGGTGHAVRRLCGVARVHCCERQWQLAVDRYRDALSLDEHSEMARVGLEQARIKHEPLPLVAD